MATSTQTQTKKESGKIRDDGKTLSSMFSKAATNLNVPFMDGVTLETDPGTGSKFVVSIDVHDLGLVGVLHLEDFPRLRTVNATGNNFLYVDVDNCCSLTHINCSNNPIETLQIRGTPALVDIQCARCCLTDLDTSQVPNLKKLDCSVNLIQVLSTLGYNRDMVHLNCSFNNLSSLQAGCMPFIKHLNCHHNRIMDLSVIPFCSKLEFLDVRANRLTSLNLMEATELIVLRCSGNKLEFLGVSGESNPVEIDCHWDFLRQICFNGTTNLMKKPIGGRCRGS
jgi:Leucine-rich repeat (LRR) protein